ncbi:MAG: phosphoribosylformylglycinamidine synthase [Lachnospiraceae bacterium]|nr:phosphoribosylformylglycinamidine synthase [Lachnospiraceae bacterium]
MVRRVYVEKKPAYGVAAKELLHEATHYLHIDGIENIRIFIRYDVENISDETFANAIRTVFAEPPVDDLYEDQLPMPEGNYRVFSVEYLPGQFDQRADSAEQCIRFLDENEVPTVRSATTYMVIGDISDEDFEKLKNDRINPVDSRATGEAIPETLEADYPEPADVAILAGFGTMPFNDFEALYQSLGLAMTYEDFLFIREHYLDVEKRDPSITEIRVLDTYWSDHCRHTTFQTELTEVNFRDGDMRKPLEDTFKMYLAHRDEIYKGRDDKYVSLWDLATLSVKKLKAEGKLDNQEESDEINACSIIVPVDVNGKEEEWLINFKNETHNHPTEIEPFGGAATCLGGAIRDPLSGRTYVYQAMRVTGAADPTRPQSETLKGKLPQKKLVRQAAHGYSSYGNQIGLATGHVKEIYHPDYVAKRMEIGAVIAAAPRSAVIRENSDPGDVIILLGGRTGRDGIGGATGSSKVHTEKSTTECGAEVQKGNAPTERKLQRLFRRREAAHLIKKCNDFGAGGVSVAIGELARGLNIDLDKVPKKYAGLDGTEIAISESQERMAVVVDPKDVDEFMKYAHEENLEATIVATVTEEPRLVMYWRGSKIVDISRDFLDTNGAHQRASVLVDVPNFGDSELNVSPFAPTDVDDSANIRSQWLATMADLNACSQRGLVEMFDSSIGAGTVTMPYGGKYQLTETQAMAAKVPVLGANTQTVTLMSYGFDPYLSKWSPYHGAVWAVTDSMAKIAASGGDVTKIRFTFQEYFRRMTSDPSRWSQPFAALLGAYAAQIGYGLPSIGGKDSMSGTFEQIDVPPTLVSFAVDVAKEGDIVTPELKTPGNKLVWIRIPRDAYQLPVYSGVLEVYAKAREDMQAGRIVSAYALERHGIAAAAAKMAFGNRLGVKIEHNLDPRDFFSPSYGDLLVEVKDGQVGNLASSYRVIGEVAGDGMFRYGNACISLDEMLGSWTGTLEDVFRTHAGVDVPLDADRGLYQADSVYICKNKTAKPHVFIPVMPGTNCEYDTARAFENAGATVTATVFRNLTAEDIRESVAEFAKEISQAQIIMFPGGFSAGDEPDGSAKFFATAFQNAKIREEVEKLLHERDGLALGICNGFQALIKLGLVPNGTITGQNADSPTLTYNTIGRHISRMVYTKVVSNKSPWMLKADLGGVYVNPASHGEGRFVASGEWLDRLFANGQVATQYCDPFGNVSLSEEWNVNGSYNAIEGITSPDGRVFGKMAHVERRGNGVAVNIYGEQDMRIFESGVAYFG